MADQCRGDRAATAQERSAAIAIEEICFQTPDASRFKAASYETTHGSNNQCRSVCFAPVMISAHCKADGAGLRS
jgi:hypothetical protein